MGISQQKLADLVGLSRSTIHRFEHGPEGPPRWYAFALAGAEPAIRRSHYLKRDRLRRLMKARKRRVAERRERENAGVGL